MAFFATIDKLPAARSQWRAKNPVDPNPPVKPRGTLPRRKRPTNACRDGFHRVMGVVYGFDRMMCKPIPTFSQHSEMATGDVIRGHKKPRRIPAVVEEDRVYKPSRRQVFVRAKIKKTIEENVEGKRVRIITLLVIRALCIWLKRQDSLSFALLPLTVETLISELEQWKA